MLNPKPGRVPDGKAAGPWKDSDKIEGTQTKAALEATIYLLPQTVTEEGRQQKKGRWQVWRLIDLSWGWRVSQLKPAARLSDSQALKAAKEWGAGCVVPMTPPWKPTPPGEVPALGSMLAVTDSVSQWGACAGTLGLNLMQVFCTLSTLCGFICASAPLGLFPWSHPPPLPLTIFVLPHPHGSLSLGDRGGMAEASHLGLSSLESHSIA